MSAIAQIFVLRRSVVIAAVLSASTSAFAGAKDESAADWLFPKWFNEWHDGLANKGLNFGATYIADNIGNVSGGVSRGAIHFGRLDLSVDADLDKLVGWTGGRFYANGYIIYGRGLSRNYIYNLATISEIEALPDQRLYNAYFEQSFFNDRLNIRAGQQAADVEFFDSQTDDLFINGTFGWPAIKATNLPAGGPAPPIAVPGIRVKAQVADNVTVFGAVFNGNPAAPGDGDPQTRDNHGLAFRVNDPPWLIGQVRFDYTSTSADSSLAGNVTPGGWNHYRRLRQPALYRGRPVARRSHRIRHSGEASRQLRNLRRHRAGALAAAGVGNRKDRVGLDTRRHRVRPHRLQPAGSQPDRSLSRRRHRLCRLYARPSARSVRDRRWPTCGFRALREASIVDTQFFTGIQSPVRSNETLIEIIYEAHIKPGWLIAPYFQYVFASIRRHPESERSDRRLADR